jgi:hypothetical protein
MVELPVGILPPPHNRRDLRFNADPVRRLLDLLRAGGVARDALLRIALLATLGSLLSSAFPASPSNPALRILLRAFVKACDAIQGIA